MYLAAVLANGHIATGRHHGEAFSNLSGEDKGADLISGHVNEDGTFTTEMDHMDKEVILIRHAESGWNACLTDDLDSSLTSTGVNQSQFLARFIDKNIDCRGVVGFTSPFDRCLLTSMPVRKVTGICFFVKSEISELSKDFPDDGVEVPCRSNKYFDIEWGNYSTRKFYKEPTEKFFSRLQAFLEMLPKKSIVVTHGSVVQTLTEMLLGVKVQQIPTWDNSIGNASITYIRNGTVVCLAKKAA